MAPDVEELIKKVNSLTLDKNRLKHRLNQLMQLPGSARENLTSSLSQSSDVSQSGACLQRRSSEESKLTKSTSTSKQSDDGNQSSKSNCSIAGVECSTSSEEDLVYANNLLKERLEEYETKWTFLESKCTALSSEVSALQKHLVLAHEEKKILEDQLQAKTDDYDNIKSELQTVVLNYETQLGAMSEHLSMITNQVARNDDL